MESIACRLLFEKRKVAVMGEEVARDQVARNAERHKQTACHLNSSIIIVIRTTLSTSRNLRTTLSESLCTLQA
jgi:hypothetical protein